MALAGCAVDDRHPRTAVDDRHPRTAGGEQVGARGPDARTVTAAWESGIRYFDTAPHYGLGLSERRLGQALREHPRDEYVISTKVGRVLVDDPSGAGRTDLDNGFAVPATRRRVWDFTADGVRRSLDDSLQRLGLDRVDIVLLHDPEESPDPEAALRQAYPALDRLRRDGSIDAIGLGSKDPAILRRRTPGRRVGRGRRRQARTHRAQRALAGGTDATGGPVAGTHLRGPAAAGLLPSGMSAPADEHGIAVSCFSLAMMHVARGEAKPALAYLR